MAAKSKVNDLACCWLQRTFAAHLSAHLYNGLALHHKYMARLSISQNILVFVSKLAVSQQPTSSLFFSLSSISVFSLLLAHHNICSNLIAWLKAVRIFWRCWISFLFDDEVNQTLED